MLAFLLILIFVALIGGAGYMVFYLLKKTDPKNVDTSVHSDIETAQDMLPFKNIKNNVIDLGGHNYRAIIEVSSLNYDLRTQQERGSINASYRRFLNSISSNISIYIQTRKIDMTQILANIEKDIVETNKKYPTMKEYSEDYFANLKELTQHIGNNKEKRKYIIVSKDYDPAMNAEGSLTDADIYEESIKELMLQAGFIVDGLYGVGLRAKILNTVEIAEMLYTALHREDVRQVDNIISGEYLQLMVESEKDASDFFQPIDYADNTLYSAMLSIKGRLDSTEDLSTEDKFKLEDILRELNKIRQLNTLNK